MPLFGDKLVCLHLHDNYAVFNGDSHLIPFDGKIDFSYVARAIRESSYQGSLMLELGNSSPNGSGAKYDGVTPEAFLQKAYSAADTLRKMI
jgi:sugar phosphate isomerase/epimerase